MCVPEKVILPRRNFYVFQGGLQATIKLIIRCIFGTMKLFLCENILVQLNTNWLVPYVIEKFIHFSNLMQYSLYKK